MERLRLKEAIVVEGRYDKNALAQVADTLILETRGFGIFSDPAQMNLLRQVAKDRGLIVLTDGDGAGFVIRNRLIGAIPKEQLRHGYIPDRFGKERRKSQRSKEGKLGVEGMDAQTLREILLAVATVLEGDAGEGSEKPGAKPGAEPISSSDFLRWGLTGAGSVERRGRLLAELGLPAQMSKKGLLDLLQGQQDREALEERILAWDRHKED